jgi:hypothetical protein
MTVTRPRAFVRGIARSFDPLATAWTAPDLRTHIDLRTPAFQRDRDAVRRDAVTIGQDLRTAMQSQGCAG